MLPPPPTSLEAASSKEDQEHRNPITIAGLSSQSPTEAPGEWRARASASEPVDEDPHRPPAQPAAGIPAWEETGARAGQKENIGTSCNYKKCQPCSVHCDGFVLSKENTF